MVAAFKVQGELHLGNASFVAGAKGAKAAVVELSEANRELARTNTTVAAATGQASQAQVTAAASARSQADGFARLAQQQASDAAAARSKQLMASVEQSSQSLQHLYGAASKAQTDAARTAATETNRATQATKEGKAANDNAARSAADSARQIAYQRTQLAFQLSDVFVQLASGQGVLRTAIQQGPQITQLYGGIGATIARVGSAALGAGAALAVTAAITFTAINASAELAARQRQAEIALEATGRQAGVTAVQIEELVRAEARRPGAGRDDTQRAGLAILGNAQITGEAVQRTLALARDLARVTGADLPAAAAALAAGLDGTVASALKLDATFHALTPSELEQIRRHELMGERAAGVGVVLTALERQLKGANERGLSPAAKAVHELSNAWDNLKDRLADTNAVRTMTGVATSVLSAVARAVTPATGPADQLAADRLELDLARQEVTRRQREFAAAQGVVGQSRANRALTAAEATVRELEQRVAQAEQRAGTAATAAAGNQTQSAATQLRTEVNAAIAAINQLDTTSGRRDVLLGQKAAAERIIGSGIADPAQIERARQALASIEGQLQTMRTPTEELQRNLDLGTTLAKLPPNARAATQAYLEMRDQVLRATGDQVLAERLAAQARDNTLQQQVTGTQQQIQLLSTEADAALQVANAYGRSRAAAIQLQAQLKAQADEQQGNIAAGTASEVAQRTLEEQAASAIAASADKNEAYAREVAGLERLVVAEGQSSTAAKETERANRVAAYAEDLRAQAAATGSATIIAAAERQIATYERLTRAATAAETNRDAQQLNRQYDPEAAFAYESDRIRTLESTNLLSAKAVQEAWKEAELKRLEASRSATDGAIAALRRYADEAGNAGSAAAQAVNTGLRSIEDVLVQVGTTGKVTWGSMINSMIADTIRLTTRAAITGPLSSAASSALGKSGIGSWFSGLFGSGGGAASAIGPGTGYTYHRGGIVGRDGGEQRAIPAEAWAAAKRFHAGGVAGLGPNERPAILLADEEVLTRSDPRHRWNLGAAAPAPPAGRVEIHFHNNTDAQVRTQETPLGGGSFRIDVFLDLIKDSIADDVSRRRGSVFGAMTGTFGVQPVGRQ